MNHRKFGRTDLHVSELCLGAMQFGWLTDQATAFAILDAFHAAGGNFIQTASDGARSDDVPAALCRSEEIVGAWWHARRVPRESLVLGTHVRLVREPGQSAPALAARVRADLEGILRRLGTTYLDVLMCEWSPAWTPPDDLLRALDELRRAGMLRQIGASGFPAWRLMECLCHSLRRDRPRFEVTQAPYSLLERAPFEPDLRELASENRVAFIAQSPLAGGVLADRFLAATDTPRARRLQARYSDAGPVMARLRQVARELDVLPAPIALAWTLRRPEVTAALIGCSRVEHVHDAVAATRLQTALAPHWSFLAGASAPAVFENTLTSSSS
jgi:aryl-alcohol dehydrogenase-like predicted oxidoreductase